MKQTCVKLPDRPVTLQQFALLLSINLTGFACLQSGQIGSMPILVAIVSARQ